MAKVAHQRSSYRDSLVIEYLARYVLKASSAQLLALTLEDMAIVQAWYHSRARDASVGETLYNLPERISEWLERKTPPERFTEGARQQPILRISIDALCENGPFGLRRDELNFLFAVYDLILRSKNRSQFQRPFECIAPHMDAIEQQRETLPEVLGLPSLLEHVMIATEATILEAPDRDIHFFGGIRQRFRGPMLVHSGTLKIIGDVPDGTAVVVERGSCYVSGYVLGHLLVGEHAEVQENISGVLIAQRGNVRARGILNRATVIAKIGRIACGGAESPALIYAGTQLRIRQSAILGTYMSPRIRVERAIHGGTWHLTNSLKAEIFAHSAKRPLDIVFRKNLGHEDFGESLPAEAVALLHRACRLQSRITYLLQLKNRQADEAEHYAITSLYYICSLIECQEELYQLDALKRRRGFILRLVMGVHMLTKSLMHTLQKPKSDRPGDSDTHQSIQLAIRQSLGEVTRELAELKLEGGYPEELDKEWHELVLLHSHSVGSSADNGLARAMLRFDESRRTWKEEALQLNEQIEVLQLRVAGDASRKSLLELVQTAGTSQLVLLQLARAARERGVNDTVVRRINTPFVRRMLELLKKRNNWAIRYGKEAAEREAERAVIHKRLREDYGIAPGVQKPDPSVEGVFEGGVRLHIEGISAALDSGSDKLLVAVPEQSGRPEIYVLQEETITRTLKPLVSPNNA